MTNTSGTIYNKLWSVTSPSCRPRWTANMTRVNWETSLPKTAQSINLHSASSQFGIIFQNFGTMARSDKLTAAVFQTFPKSGAHSYKSGKELLFRYRKSYQFSGPIGNKSDIALIQIPFRYWNSFFSLFFFIVKTQAINFVKYLNTL